MTSKTNMNRRHFLAACIATLSAASLRARGGEAAAGVLKRSELRFGVITDIHQDIMPDAHERLQSFLTRAQEAKVDFIIDLGDFCMVKPENRYFANLFNSFDGEKYHVLGNHDMDNCSKAEFMQFVGMKRRFYAFDKGDYRFFVLDPNNLYSDGTYTPYRNANFYVDSSKRAFIDPEQMEWLERELRMTTKRCILFSHQSIENSLGNGAQVRQLLEQANSQAGYKKVVAAFSGHDHTSYEKQINGITYIQINSASNQWVGSKYACTDRFDEEANRRRPAVRNTTPYVDALHAIVTLDSSSLSLEGIESRYMPPTPQDLNIPEDLHSVPSLPSIKNFSMEI